MMSGRAYLDYNATAPMRAEAKAAVIEAMDVVGNPSSVHAEGRAATKIVARARAQIAEAFGASGADVVFTAGATEAAALAMAGRGLACAPVEHECVKAWCDASLVVEAGQVVASDPKLAAVQQVNSETGVLQRLPEGVAVTDAVQAAGKVPWAFSWSGADMAMLAAHKFGGPKGVGALILKQGLDVPAQMRGGGQEMGRRAGTENIAAIAGMGAAAEAAARDLEAGVWDRVAELRIILEKAIEDASPETILVGKDMDRLPNTACFITPGWKGESQVMAMDLAGYAISAGSACSSGKVRGSATLMAMGFEEAEAASAIRVSLGPETTETEVLGFARIWAEKRDKQRSRAA